MKDREQGRVLPFGMSAMRMRRSAREYRRRGQLLESLSLVRRAALQDDSAAGWHALAAEMKQLGCWEAASVLLGRVLSRGDAPAAAWMDMAGCMSALGSRDTAEDCLYHLLYEDPWGTEAESARTMLQEMDAEKAEEEPGRAERLIRRAMQSWQEGAVALGMRRMRRAVRLSRSKAQPLTALALMYMSQGRMTQTIRCLAKAVNAEKDNPMPLCTLATVLCEQDRCRMARGLLAKAAPLCREAQTEDRFCSVAWLLDAWPELEAFLQVRLQRTPYRIPLLHAKARMQHERGLRDDARETWRLILSVDPEDRQASALMAWTQQKPESMLPPITAPLPMTVRQKRMLEDAPELFRPGSESRRVLDWCVASPDDQEGELAFAAALCHPDREAEVRWLREVMMRPDVPEERRRQAVQRLSDLKQALQCGVFVSGRFMTVQSPEEQKQTPGRLWRMFLPVLLRVAGRDEECSGVVAFAAEKWPLLTPTERQDAAGQESVSWSRVFQLLWLWEQGRHEEAAEIVQKLRMPLRRFRRVMSMLQMTMENMPGDAGEGDTGE